MWVKKALKVEPDGEVINLDSDDKVINLDSDGGEVINLE